MTTTQSTTASQFREPGNRRDRERFAALTPWAQDRVRFVASKMYDGTRTVARCWALGLEAEEEGSWESWDL